ncbi:glycosyl hydrolase 53 family protein [Anaerocolumna sp. AGMB13020]|uniref:glycosyl hydrolase 53 family protein n=1 Tax=Anaerocolumna sp. AGMB13020 TaxID=3081750 RepID=UPI002952E099|nr:glycosyl hydrolase 53 family protein [Anaerocolumna sp. AGMB13020]WOO35291.1 glycosyl hydrolase 53 family protein [Anaerocolumna sp. AGMB13020]
MDFIKGMDISFLPELKELEAKFYDEEGNRIEVLKLLQENGVNSIRLRLWNEPENVPESGGYCSLEQTIAMAKQIKQNGMSFFLDFHYSDWWADPGKQVKPKTWEKLGFHELVQAVYEYTRNVLLKMQEEGVLPDMVQIGNEIRSGMLFPEGEVPNYRQLALLVNSGIRAVREINKEIKIVIHLDQGGRYYYLQEWFDAVMAEGLEHFDIIGVSYYPFWHGSFTDLKDSLVKLVKRYGKPIVVAETAHAWRNAGDGFFGEQQERIAGFPASPWGQKQVLDLVMNITASLEHEMGLGIYYWEPVVLPVEGKGGWWSNMGVFNEKGVALPALGSFRFIREDFRQKEIAKIYEPEKILHKLGEEVKLPESIKVLYYDGESNEVKVAWEKFYADQTGDFRIRGNMDSIGKTVEADIQVVEYFQTSHNYIGNADFEDGLRGWEIKCEDSRVKVELLQEFDEPFPAPPSNYIYVESPVNFNWKLERKVEGLTPGNYSLSVEYRGTNTTGVDVRLYAGETGCNDKELVIYPTDENWVTYELPDIKIEKDSVKLGMKMVSPPVFGKIRKLKLRKMQMK